MPVETYFSPFRFKNKDQQRIARLEWIAAKLMTAGMYLEAIEDYTRVLVLDPKNVSAYLHRGKAFLALSSLEDAYFDFKAGRYILENNISMYKAEKHWCIEVYTELLLLEELTAIKLGQTESFINKLLPVNEGVVPDPTTETYANIAKLIAEMNIAEKAKDYGTAISALSGIIRLDPERLSAYMKRGKLHSKIKEYRLAAADFSSGWYLMDGGKGYIVNFTPREKKLYELFVARHKKAIERLAPFNLGNVKSKIAQLFMNVVKKP